MKTHQESSKTTATAQASAPFFAPVVQRKLTVNQPGDHFEQQADAIADQVMRMKTGDAPIVQRMPFSSISGGLQRKCAACEGDEKLHRKETSGGDASGKAAPASVQNALASGGGNAMDGSTRQFMESRFGQDFSGVRIKTDAKAAQSAADIQARAYTSGSQIVFGAGEYRPASEDGRRLLAHELVHVGQQGDGIKRLIRTSLVTCPGHNPYSDDRKASTLLGNASTKIANAITNHATTPTDPDVVAVISAMNRAFRLGNSARTWATTLPIIKRRIDAVKSYIDSVVFTINCVPAGGNHAAPGGAAGTCDPGTEAFSWHVNPTNIVLCDLYFTRNSNQKARTFMHEVFHIAFRIVDDWGQPDLHNAHCYAQFVSLLNGFNSLPGYRCH